jgi:hypothetical protein
LDLLRKAFNSLIQSIDLFCQVDNLVSKLLFPLLHLRVSKHHDLLLITHFLILILQHDNEIPVLRECLLMLHEFLLFGLQVRIELLERLLRLGRPLGQLLHRLLAVPQVLLQLLYLKLATLHLPVFIFKILNGLSELTLENVF